MDVLIKQEIKQTKKIQLLTQVTHLNELFKNIKIYTLQFKILELALQKVIVHSTDCKLKSVF